MGRGGKGVGERNNNGGRCIYLKMCSLYTKKTNGQTESMHRGGEEEEKGGREGKVRVK